MRTVYSPSSARPSAPRAEHVEPAFVGRSGLLHSVEEAVDRGGPQVVLLDGPAGIGKSRLLQELNRRMAERGAVVLAGNATEFEQVLPFGAFVDVIEAARQHGVRLPEGAGDHSRLSGLEQIPFYRSIREAIDELDAPHGVLLVLDDVQWADEASLGLLEFLLHRPPLKLTAVVTSYRTGMCPPRLTRALHALDEPATHVRVPPLAQTDVETRCSPACRRAVADS